MNYKEKLINKFYKVIGNELDKLGKIENKDEIIHKMGELKKFYLVFSNYEELEPTLKKFFDEKANRDRFKGDAR